MLLFQSFITRSTSFGVAKVGNLKLDFFFFGTPEFIFWFVEIIQNLKIAFVRMDTLSPFHDSTIIVVTGSNTVAMYCGRLSFGCNCRKL